MSQGRFLDYGSLPRSRWRFARGFVVGLCVALGANLLPFILTYHAYDGDGYQRIGFPFEFSREGGVEYRRWFSRASLIADIGIGLATAAGAGLLWMRTDPRRRKGNWTRGQDTER